MEDKACLINCKPNGGVKHPCPMLLIGIPAMFLVHVEFVVKLRSMNGCRDEMKQQKRNKSRRGLGACDQHREMREHCEAVIYVSTEVSMTKHVRS